MDRYQWNGENIVLLVLVIKEFETGIITTRPAHKITIWFCSVNKINSKDSNRECQVFDLNPHRKQKDIQNQAQENLRAEEQSHKHLDFHNFINNSHPAK